MKTIFLLFGLLIPSLGIAQTYSIDWFKVAAGGGVSSNGQYSVSGTIGQQDASGAMTGGSYSLTGGFWALYAVQTTGAPLLTISVSGARAILTWPTNNATGFTLHSTHSLGAGAVWTTNSPAPVVISGQNVVTNPISATQMFFRLMR